MLVPLAVLTLVASTLQNQVLAAPVNVDTSVEIRLRPRHDTGSKSATPFKSLVIFGDSFSDDGHGAWLASNGTWPADPAYYQHHFSNGPVWGQVVSQATDITLLDFAAGGATANNDYIAGYTGPNSTIPVPASQDQIDTYLKLFKPQPNDLYVIFIGANDAFFSTNVTGSDTAKLISGQVRQLKSKGATNILLANYPDLDTLPFAYTSGSTSAYNTFLSNYSKDLRAGLRSIKSSYSDAKLRIDIIDVHALFEKVLKDPKSYGFNPKTLTQACLKGAYASEGVKRSLCSDPDEYLFWDIYHPTRRAHKLVAGLFEETIGKWSTNYLKLQ